MMISAMKSTTCVLLIAVLSFASCSKTSQQGNRLPVSNAGEDRIIILPADTVQLDGSGSGDSDQIITAYSWTKISGPSSFAIINASMAKSIVKNLVEGVYTFELKVTDKFGRSVKDTIIVSVITLPAGGRVFIGVWKPAANGMMFLKDSSRQGDEPTFDFGYGWEPNIPKEYDFYVKHETNPQWMKLKYVFARDLSAMNRNSVVSSFIIEDQGQPVYFPTVYATQNAGVDFSKNTALYCKRK